MQNKNYWSEPKDETTTEIKDMTTTEILLALEPPQKDKHKTPVRSVKEQSAGSEKTRSKGKPKPKRQVVKSKTSENVPKKTGKAKKVKVKVKEFKGVRSSKIRKEYAHLKVYNLKNSVDEEFKSFSNNFMENERKLDIEQTDVVTKMNGIYPNCLMYLDKQNIFIAGSNNHSQNYLVFIHFIMDGGEDDYTVDYMVNIPAVDKVTRLSCNSKQSQVIISFNNEYNSCLDVRSHDRRPELAEKKTMKGVCLWSSNQADMLMTSKMETRAQKDPGLLERVPVIKHLWSIEHGFYYKAVDFLKININSLLSSKYWAKTMDKSVKKRLNSIVEKTLRKKTRTGEADETRTKRCKWSRSSCCAGSTVTRKSW